MFLHITNMKLLGDNMTESEISKVVAVMSNALNNTGIRASVRREGASITFGQVDPSRHPNKLFISANENKIKLREGDPRIAKLGRDYLTSYRLTKEQYTKMKDIIFGMCDRLAIECDITMKGKTNEVWREGLINMAISNEPTSFSVK